MTAEQLAALKIGDAVRLRKQRGRVTRTTNTWFMVTWDDGNVETIRRTVSILTDRLQLEITA